MTYDSVDFNTNEVTNDSVIVYEPCMSQLLTVPQQRWRESHNSFLEMYFTRLVSFSSSQHLLTKMQYFRGKELVFRYILEL